MQNHSPESRASLVNFNPIGANYLAQNYGVEQWKINALKVFLSYLFNNIVLGQIISLNGIQIELRFYRCWKTFFYFFL